jgi:hypothetical protein
MTLTFTTIRNWLSLAVAILVLHTIAGCASVNGIDTKPPLNESGVAVVSLGSAPLSGFGPMSLYIRDINTKAFGEFRVAYDAGWPTPRTPIDFASVDGNGYVTALRMPPGNYEITNFAKMEANTRISAKITFSIPFNIEKGKTTYLGEYLAYMNRKPTYSLSSRFFFSRMVVQDRQTRDIDVMTKRMPEIATYPVINAILKANSPSPLVLTKPPYILTAEEIEKYNKAVADQIKETMDAVNKPKCPTPVC